MEYGDRRRYRPESGSSGTPQHKVSQLVLKNTPRESQSPFAISTPLSVYDLVVKSFFSVIDNDNSPIPDNDFDLTKM